MKTLLQICVLGCMLILIAGAYGSEFNDDGNLEGWTGSKSTIDVNDGYMVVGVTADIAGPVGIAVITGQVTRLGFIYVLQFTAMLSINLAIINAFPFPALDGGRLLFLLIEKVIGRPVKREVEAVIHNVGFALLMLLILVVTFRDFSRFGDSFRLLWDKIIG